MPKDFDDCVKNNGKVITKKLKNGKYIHICFDKNGNSYAGEVKKKKKEKSRERIIKKAKTTKEELMVLQKLINEKYHN